MRGEKAGPGVAIPVAHLLRIRGIRIPSRRCADLAAHEYFPQCACIVATKTTRDITLRNPEFDRPIKPRRWNESKKSQPSKTLNRESALSRTVIKPSEKNAKNNDSIATKIQQNSSHRPPSRNHNDSS